jgi:hypothetical protein
VAHRVTSFDDACSGVTVLHPQCRFCRRNIDVIK